MSSEKNGAHGSDLAYGSSDLGKSRPSDYHGINDRYNSSSLPYHSHSSSQSHHYNSPSHSHASPYNSPHYNNYHSYDPALDPHVMASNGDLVRIPTNSCCSFSFNLSNYIYGVFFGLLLILSIVFKEVLKHVTKWIPFDICSSSTCQAYQMVYRFSFAGVLFFALMTIITFFWPLFHVSNWFIKMSMFSSLCSLSFFIPAKFFLVYRDITRYTSFFYLLIQVILLVNFAYLCHEYMVKKMDQEPESAKWRWLYLGSFIALTLLSIIGFIFIYINNGSCAANNAIISLVLISCLFFIIACSTERINKGVLAPAVLTGYLVLMTYQTLSANTSTSCNNYENNPPLWRTISLIAVNIITLSFNTLRNASNSHQLLDDEEQVENGHNQTQTPPNLLFTRNNPNNHGYGGYRVEYMSKKKNTYFHIVMIFACGYISMLLTNWGSEGFDGNINISAVEQSFIIQVIYLFLTILLFAWTVLAPIFCVNRDFGNGAEAENM